MSNILDEIANAIRTLTGRSDLVICGSYTDKNDLLSVQVNAGKKPISDDDLLIIRDLYGLKCQKTYDTRSKGYNRILGRNIRYLLGISIEQISLIQ